MRCVEAISVVRSRADEAVLHRPRRPRPARRRPSRRRCPELGVSERHGRGLSAGSSAAGHQSRGSSVVAPVRCATPGIEVACDRIARSPVAASTSQSAMTPPPSPPSAAIRIVNGRACAGTVACRCVARRCSRDREPLSSATVPQARVLDDFGAIERRAQHRGMRVLAAQAAADAAVDHVRHRVAPQRSGLSLTVSVGQPERRMQEWSPVQVSSSTPYFTRTMRSPSLQAPRADRAATGAGARAGTRLRRR